MATKYCVVNDIDNCDINWYDIRRLMWTIKVASNYIKELPLSSKPFEWYNNGYMLQKNCSFSIFIVTNKENKKKLFIDWVKAFLCQKK